MTARPRVFFFGSLPPPVHGMALVNKQMVELIAQFADVSVADTSPGGLSRGIAYHLRKMAKVARSVLHLCWIRLGGARRFYGAADDNWGGLYTVLILVVARLLLVEVHLHHHSYRYLNTPKPVMRLLTFVAGPKAVHVVLGNDMDARLRLLYPRVRQTRICGNCVAEPERIFGPRSGTLHIGMMSNLSVAKGLPVMLDLVAQATVQKRDAKFVLAGPVPDQDMQDALHSALTTYGDIVEYRGPVSGESKEAFFADVDLFLLPSQSEAFPLVLMEALLRGVRVISFDRGCISDLADLPGVHIVPGDGDFCAEALLQIEAFDRERHNKARPPVIAAAHKRNDENRAGLTVLAQEIAGAGTPA